MCGTTSGVAGRLAALQAHVMIFSARVFGGVGERIQAFVYISRVA